MLIPIEISSFATDAATGQPVVVCKEISGSRTLLLTLDACEARAIAFNWLEKSPALPHTIDLTRTLVENLRGKFEKVVLSDRRKGLLCAFLYVRSGKRVSHYVCRVSDGVALALRCEIPLLALEALLDKAGEEPVLSEAQKLRRNILAIDTLRFGEFIIE